MASVNVLVVMPKTATKIADAIFPSGVAYVSAYLKSKGYNVFTLNLNLYDDIQSPLERFIRECYIDVVMTGGLSREFHIVKQILDKVRSIDKDVVNIVGGGLISAQPRIAMEALQVADIGVLNEGEITTACLCEALNNEDDLSQVTGIIYKTEGEYVLNEKREDIAGLDLLPFPDYEGFSFGKYIEAKSSVENDVTKQLRNVYIIGSRSCPYNCTFCFHTSGKKYRIRSLSNIFTEIDFLYNTYGVNSISFQDELFAADKKRLFEFCQRIKNYDLHWFCSLRVDLVDDEVLDAIKDSGCTLIGLGLESADDTILKSMNKHITRAQIESALKKIDGKGIPFFGNLIFGDKGETVGTAENTLNWWLKHKDYNISLGLVVPFPGSCLYHYAVKHNIIRDEVSYLKEGCPQVNVSRMTDEQFGQINAKILQYPLSLAPKYTDYTYSNKTLKAKCIDCGVANEYNFEFFETDFVICKECGRKYYVPVNNSLSNAIAQAIRSEIRYNHIAIWGINAALYDFLTSNDVFSDERIHFIDISRIMQMTCIQGKRIESPDIIPRHSIKLVITGNPGIFIKVKMQVENKYPGVERICTMADIISEARNHISHF